MKAAFNNWVVENTKKVAAWPHHVQDIIQDVADSKSDKFITHCEGIISRHVQNADRKRKHDDQNEGQQLQKKTKQSSDNDTL